MSKSASRFALVCAVVGLGASLGAAYIHYHLLFDPTYRSFCDVSARISCTELYQSRFSTFQGIPVAIFGAFWFVVAGLLSVAGRHARRDAVRESVPGYLFVLSTFALAVVLYLGYASFVLVKVVCILCLLTYAAVIGLFAVSGAATSFPMTTLPRRLVHDLGVFVGRPLAVVVAVLFFVGAASTLAFFPRERRSAEAARLMEPSGQDQRSELERFMATRAARPARRAERGRKGADRQVQRLSVPARAASRTSQYKPILAKYQATNPGAVKVVMKDYPLNSECNANVLQMIHPAACDAAVAVRLATPHNREAMEEWLYTHQQEMTPPIVRQAARDVGQVTDFDAKYPITIEQVKGDVALGKQLDVKSTPTFFINGVKVEGAWAPQYFEQAIAYELHARQQRDRK